MTTGLSSLAALMTPIQPGQNAKDVLTSERLQAWQMFMFALAQGENIQAPINMGIQKKSGPLWCMLTAEQKRQGDTSARNHHPFELIPSTKDSGPQLTVFLDSWLMNSGKADDKVTISGLGTEFPIAINQFVYLKAAIAEGKITAVSVQHGPRWTEYPENAKFTGTGDAKKQVTAYRLIGYTQPYPGSGSENAGKPDSYPERLLLAVGGTSTVQMQIVQCLRTNLLASSACDEKGVERITLADNSSVPGPR